MALFSSSAMHRTCCYSSLQSRNAVLLSSWSDQRRRISIRSSRNRSGAVASLNTMEQLSSDDSIDSSALPLREIPGIDQSQSEPRDALIVDSGFRVWNNYEWYRGDRATNVGLL